MPFDLNVSKATDVPDIVKYDARAGRLFKVEYDRDAREKQSIDISSPPPRFAVDFGSLEVGYVRYTATGPDYHMKPEGVRPMAQQPADKDENGRLLYRAGFRLKIYGKVLGGLREWSSAASCVLEALDELYGRFREAPEAAKGLIPIVELSRTIPVTFGKGAKASTSYAPCFAITGWTGRVTEMGERTVPAPTAPAAAPAVVTKSSNTADGSIDDEIPF
jgi:hypothetical protein